MNLPLPIVGKAATEAQSAHELLARYTVPNYGRLALAPERGEGVWLWDAGGRQYLDFGGGVAVTSLGHCPPVITRALAAQAGKLIHCSNWYEIRGQGELGKFLTETVMESPGKTLFCNSGAEANEALIKLARKFGHATPLPDGTPRTGILTFFNSFHGRTYAGISATGQEKVKTGFAPLVPGFTHLPYNDFAAVEKAVAEAPDTVAILVEPVQGEGGVHVATADFLRGLARICREKNILLLFDDVQSGIGRCGHWCGWKTAAPEIIPDGVSWAKGIGGGFPIGAAWIRQRPIQPGPDAPDLCDILGPGTHGTTYGGSPLACAVASAVLTEIHEKGLCGHAAAIGAEITDTVQGWDHPLVREVRGAGLLLGFVLNPDALPVPAAAGEAATLPSIRVVKALMAEGLLSVAAGPEVIRWLPPLNVTREETATALGILRRVLDRLAAPAATVPA
ncbi:MAG: acetylornithine and succinylornithine aminotransferase [Verrucomicrobiales bacterium]|nr:acetylornithine and succinylornithine aminotransferase [Verrucomicrobiales bacterium]